MPEGSLLVVAVDVVQAANDKQQLEPMLNQVVALPEVLGNAETCLLRRDISARPMLPPARQRWISH